MEVVEAKQDSAGVAVGETAKAAGLLDTREAYIGKETMASAQHSRDTHTDIST